MFKSTALNISANGVTINAEPKLPRTKCDIGLDPKKSVCRSTGFTLIEILLVMILLAVAGSLVYGNIGKSVTEKKTKVFARKMISLCKLARQKAMDSGLTEAFYISSDEKYCWIGNREKPVEIPAQMLVEGEGISQLNDDIYAVHFYPDGSSSGGELTLRVLNEPAFAFRIDRLTGLLSRIEIEE